MPEGLVAADPFAPLTTKMVDVGDGHQIYVETVGHPLGIPAVYLHGGPGSGCQPAHRRLFDPDVFRAVLFDQRGAGRSTPHGERAHNTTDHLIADMENIRERLGIERWLVVGGSWGATLALAYAQAYPERVTGIVLRATFLGTRQELEWAFGTGLSRFYPQLYADFLNMLSPDERHAPLDAYWRRILSTDPDVSRTAIMAWYQTERVLSQINPSQNRLDHNTMKANTSARPSTPAMEAHYFSNDCFLAPNQLMDNAPVLDTIPGRIIQGRYDLLCPPSTAYALAERWPGAKVIPIAGAGHSQSEPGVEAAMQQAISELAHF